MDAIADNDTSDFNLTSYRHLPPEKGSSRTYPRSRKPVLLGDRVVVPTRSHLSQHHVFFTEPNHFWGREIARARRRRSLALRTRLAAETDEGRDLARSNTPLPSDRDRD